MTSTCQLKMTSTRQLKMDPDAAWMRRVGARWGVLATQHWANGIRLRSDNLWVYSRLVVVRCRRRDVHSGIPVAGP